MAGLNALPDEEVHVWVVRPDEVRDPVTLDRCAALMSADERARHDRFVFAKDRHLYLVTRGTIRTLVGRYLETDPAACTFVANRYGRPSLAHPGGSGLAFNVSHTAGLIVCAFAREPEIGVDVEEACRTIDLALARRFFSPAEADALDALPEAERPDRFFDYWTLKEAYIKARGMGLSLPLDGFAMLLDAGPSPAIRFSPAIDDDATTWQFAQFTPTSRHRLAVAVRRRGRDRDIRLREFQPDASLIPALPPL